MGSYNGLKVFSATKARDRESLGEKITQWLRSVNVEITHKEIHQSSDNEFHCLSVVLFFK